MMMMVTVVSLVTITVAVMVNLHNIYIHLHNNLHSSEDIRFAVVCTKINLKSIHHVIEKSALLL